MRWDSLNLPIDNGASDRQDSARLAGILAVFDWPQYIPLHIYFREGDKKYVRHPEEDKYDFSRDQAICLMAGFYSESMSHFVKKEYVDGKDFFSPSHNGHVRICQGLKPRWYQKLWLWLDIIYSCFYQPMGEPNQILCMLMVHPDPRFLKFWLKYNKHWRDAIREYWCEKAGEWRGERELADHMIHVLGRKVNG